jgi:uncharacterized membrane protein YeiH
VTLLRVLDVAGVLVFGLSGALLAVERRLDVFGMLVLSLAAALGGGVLRDVLLDAHPPAALADPAYLAAGACAAVVVGAGARVVVRLAPAVRLFDAAGLGLFVATGTAKALDAGLGAPGAVVIGCLTGIGGGVLRDVLAGDVPVVLRRELYAVPAAVGAALVVAADGLGVDGSAAAVTAASAVFTLRMVALWRDWHAPVLRLHGS